MKYEYNSLGGNTKLMKKINRHLVLNSIYEKTNQSSSDIAREYKLQRSTVTNIVNELIKEEHIRVSGVGTSTKGGGKPPTLLEINPDFGYVIGVEILPKEIRLVLMNYKAETIFKERYNYPRNLGEASLVPELVKIVENILKKFKIRKTKILGMGLGLSGMVNYDKGLVHYSIGLNLVEYPIVEHLKAHFKFPVYIDNDANVAALAEQWFGMAKNHGNVIFMSINEEVTGVGCGLIFNHDVYRGITKTAGEVSFDLPPVEKILTEKGFDEYPKIEKESLAAGMNIIQYLCQHQETPWAQAVIEELGAVLGNEISKIINFVNPEIVLLGGEISNTAEHLVNPIKKFVDNRALKIPKEAVNVETTSFGLFAVSVGATVLVFGKMFKKIKKQYSLEEI